MRTKGCPAAVLSGHGVTLEVARERVVAIVGAGEHEASGQIPFTPRAKKVLELALRECRSRGSNSVGPEHILLGLVRENEGVASSILRDFGADAQTVRDEVLAALKGGPIAAADAAARELPALDWRRASLQWRPDGLELRVPMRLREGAIAAFGSDPAWSTEPLAGLRRELWRGWLSLASPKLLEEVEPSVLRDLLDGAAKRATEAGTRQQGRVEDFLRNLRDGRT